MNDYFISIILGIVEGLTEFLPVSSTGHLILVNEFAGFPEEFEKMFDIVIQLGAIVAVVAYFWKRVMPIGKHVSAQERKNIFTLWMKTIVGVVPALGLGALLANYIEKHLFNPVTVALALIIGGVILIILENRKKTATITSVEQLSYTVAFLIGIIQCISMIPGTSRSAATIIGAMALGSSRLVAAEFSFFLAIPTIFAASVYSLLKPGFSLNSHEFAVLGVGFLTSFIIAYVVIAAFMNYISNRDFKPFGYYRIILGLVVLGYFLIW